MIIIGANELGEQMNDILEKDLSYGYKILGTFDDTLDPKINHTLPLLGGFKDIDA